MLQTEAPSTIDLGQILDHGPWTGFQKLVLFLSSITVILDGFDNQLLGFIMPALIKEWGVSRSAFVPVVTSGLIAMCIGTAIAGGLGDRFGRRPVLIATVLLFGLATGASALVQNLISLTIFRIAASLGIGGAIPIATALLAEYAPLNRRNLSISIGMLCVPIGGLIGGLIAASVLPNFGWRPLFVIGGLLPLVAAAAMLIALPESPRFLAGKPQRLPELLKILRRYRHIGDAPMRFVDSAEHAVGHTKETILGSRLRRDSLGLWAAFFSSLFANYLVFNWAPTMLSGVGYDLAATSRGLAGYNFGGIIGALAGSWLMDRYGSRLPLLATAAAGAVLAIGMFLLLGVATPSPAAIITAFAAQGMFIAGLQVMLFALAVHIYPSAIRAQGVGMALAVGRTGALVGAASGASILALGHGGIFGGIAVAALCALAAISAVRRHMRPI
jgi:AAHS family 4-hydroxybenzoate transporter-like MFS transporter